MLTAEPTSSPSSPLTEITRFFDSIPQKIMLSATTLAICGVAYAILALNASLLMYSATLALTCYYASEKMQEVKELRAIQTEIKDLASGATMTLVQIRDFMGSQIEKLTKQNDRQEELNNTYERLNKLHPHSATQSV